MSCSRELERVSDTLSGVCLETRDAFSAYLDGALDGHTMGRLANHLDSCPDCRAEFAAWRSMQDALGALGPARLPIDLQAQLRDALASEISTGRHLSPVRRFAAFTQRTLAPVGLRFAAGFAATMAILGSAACFLGTALPVQANDDRMAHLNAPKFLYFQTPPEPVAVEAPYVAVVVNAKVDAAGRVYDYDIVDGPKDKATRVRIEANLLDRVFKPATVFGEPVPGHAMVMMTSTTVSARS